MIVFHPANVIMGYMRNIRKYALSSDIGTPWYYRYFLVPVCGEKRRKI
jgi:hypothetical protein